jgi:hypothetical protein
VDNSQGRCRSPRRIAARTEPHGRAGTIGTTTPPPSTSATGSYAAASREPSRRAARKQGEEVAAEPGCGRDTVARLRGESVAGLLDAADGGRGYGPVAGGGVLGSRMSL